MKDEIERIDKELENIGEFNSYESFPHMWIVPLNKMVNVLQKALDSIGLLVSDE